jgi:hypothetical protein
MDGEEKKRLEEIKEALRQGAVGETFLYEAVQKRHLHIVKFLVMRGTKINGLVDQQGDDTPLDLAFKIAEYDSVLKNVNQQEAQHKNHERSDQVLKFLCKSKNVPPDGNCLFWAVALAYLLPVKDNEKDFQNRLQKLFGDCDETTTASILATLRQYNPFSDKNNVSKDSTLKEKVANVFRGRVVDHMLNNSDNFRGQIDFEESDFEKFLKKLNTSGFESYLKDNRASDFNQFLEQNPLQFKMFVENNKSNIKKFCNDNKTSFKRYIETEEGDFNDFLHSQNLLFESYDKVIDKTKLVREILMETSFYAYLDKMRIPGSNLLYNRSPCPNKKSRPLSSKEFLISRYLSR